MSSFGATNPLMGWLNFLIKGALLQGCILERVLCQHRTEVTPGAALFPGEHPVQAAERRIHRRHERDLGQRGREERRAHLLQAWLLHCWGRSQVSTGLQEVRELSLKSSSLAMTSPWGEIPVLGVSEVLE